MPRLVVPGLAFLVLALAGCGEDSVDRSTLRTPGADTGARPSAEPERESSRRSGRGSARGRDGGDEPLRRVTRAELAVIRGWSDALRHGQVERAVAFFSLPSRVSNGQPPFELRTRAAVRFFNESLPCGARLEATQRVPHGFILATFELTERPGKGRCGSGSGQRARTLFYIERGKIVQWLRATDPPPPADGDTS